LLELLRHIINSFESARGKGLPLGNVTSQLFANIYLNEFDHYVKHILKARHYIRYCDDFVILDNNRFVLEHLTEEIRSFLRNTLVLQLHPYKVTIRKLRHGTDFLGYVSLPHYLVLRTRTKRRMLRRLAALAQVITNKKEFESALPVIRSYLGILSHCKGEELRKRIEKLFEKWR
jgi:hypothetical protein